eukprot:TRINITY_DN19903_c0_g1_i1.p1 TRINITY_DN19903_c0_g1~~TRINITY_DN19903_c0_g1_i1.p1  ORF type:complete len:124 (-),score=17.76 TRINITY_DN19903_c0_g1_i1:12-383(-)
MCIRDRYYSSIFTSNKRLLHTLDSMVCLVVAVEVQRHHHVQNVPVGDTLLGAVHSGTIAVSYTHLRAHETPEHLVCRLLLEKKKKSKENNKNTKEISEITRVEKKVEEDLENKKNKIRKTVVK